MKPDGNNPALKYIRAATELSRYRLSLLVSAAAAVGNIIVADGPSSGLAPATAGVFLLACGASALNQYQERETDALMERTMRRPLPAGRVAPLTAFSAAAAAIVSGAAILLLWAGVPAFVIGLFAVAWYNGVYTYLKKKTAFAAVPGALVGAAAPAIGWVSAGGSLMSRELIAIAFFFFIWQMPHFWLSGLTRGDEYRKAGFPSAAGVFGTEGLARITFMWMLSAALSCMLLPLFGLADSVICVVTVMGITGWIIFRAVKILKSGGDRQSFALAFRDINMAVLLLAISLAAPQIVGFLQRG